MNKIITSSLVLFGTLILSSSSFARVASCNGAATNVINNGGSCEPITFGMGQNINPTWSCTGSSGNSFTLVPNSNANTGCTISSAVP